MIGGAVPHDDQLVLGPFGPESAQNIDGVLAVGAGIGPEPHLRLRCRDRGRRTRACPTDAARARQPRGAGRAPTSHSRDRHPGGCALRPGRPADGGRAGHRRGDPGSARQRPAGAPDRPGRAAFWPSSRTAPDDAGRRGSSPGSRSGRTSRAPSQPDGAASSAALDRLRLRAGLRRSVGRHGPSRQGRLRSPGKDPMTV